MTPSSDRDEAGKGRPLFLATLWMAIWVALLCALAPLGPPASKLTGSAFNPATTAVLLKARSPAAPEASRMVRPEREGPAPSSLPAPPLPIVPLLTMLAIAFLFLRAPASLSSHAARLLASAAIGHRPPARAPPLS
ncbi:hypothetical protein [Sphingobium baderi]|uniref:Uncharacterized protein n=1 Tax=Sphingobium baderi LL03 TaxID=1114964 RepID=T0G7N3_9SPHN|nr:hypothetical protein [Sphingobium baderi]EQA96631.1 hypothetical protein L485_24165 [Sphingobium baderi LL03]KMS64308.1 hypothetical protein V475_11875 [Sphingobium baderi LL03]